MAPRSVKPRGLRSRRVAIQACGRQREQVPRALIADVAEACCADPQMSATSYFLKPAVDEEADERSQKGAGTGGDESDASSDDSFADANDSDIEKETGDEEPTLAAGTTKTPHMMPQLDVSKVQNVAVVAQQCRAVRIAFHGRRTSLRCFCQAGRPRGSEHQHRNK